MFKWFTLLCIKLSKRLGPFDAGRAIYDFASNMLVWVLLLLIVAGHSYGTSYGPAALMIAIVMAAALYTINRCVLGHQCVFTEVPASYEVDCYESVYNRLVGIDNASCAYMSAFNGSDAELEYIDDYVVKLIREHIRDVPMFEKVKSNRYTGEVVFYRDRGTAAVEWCKRGLSLGMAGAFHVVSTNVSYVYIGNKGYAELVETVLHERLHSMATDESAVVFASMFLLLKYGTPEERFYARTAMLSHCSACKYNSYDQYSYCVKYFDQYWDRLISEV